MPQHDMMFEYNIVYVLIVSHRIERHYGVVECIMLY
jgi:hypothetical protein